MLPDSRHAGPVSTPTTTAGTTGTVTPGTPPATRTLLVLGASGDLAGRLLLPGLGQLLASGRGEGLRLVGSGVEPWDDARWRDRVRETFAVAGSGDPETVEPTDGDAVAGVLASVEASTTYLAADVTRSEDMTRLLSACEPPVALYFALPPAVTAASCAALRDVVLPDDTRLVLEKPFGTDLASARSLNALVAALVPEDQVFRVDHFLAKHTVLNILGLRFANRLLEPVWNAGEVAEVEIVFDEDLGLEGRARYYDHAGALRDMVQSHLLQVMAVLAMDPPATLSARDVRDRKGEVLRATRPGADLRATTRRARYTAGEVDGRQLPDYADEPGVDPALATETLAEVTLFVDSWRWAGVPFRLRSGKALGHARKEAVITFRPVPHLPTGLSGTTQPARLRLGFGPDTLTLELDVNGPGDPLVLDRVALTATFGQGDLSAYGEVLAGVLDGDPSLSVRGDNAEECWRIIEPVLAAWAAGEVPLEEYTAGSTGFAPR